MIHVSHGWQAVLSQVTERAARTPGAGPLCRLCATPPKVVGRIVRVSTAGVAGVGRRAWHVDCGRRSAMTPTGTVAPLAEPVAPAEAGTIVDVLRYRARCSPAAHAYTFLTDGEEDERRITYGQLERRARAVAAELQTLGMTGERAMLLFAPGLDYVVGFYACLLARVVAVPAYPPEPMRLERTLPRLQKIVADARAACVLTTSDLLPARDAIGTLAPELASLTWVAGDAVSDQEALRWRPCEVSGDDIAFLQYTSGSTGDPKGVMVTHGNLVHNVQAQMESAGLSRDPSHPVVSWLPPYHDMGLIGGIICPLFTGVPSVLMSPVHFLRRPLRWLQALSRHRAQASPAPNFAYDLCVRKVPEAQRAGLDLSSWRSALNGAETVRADTIERFVEAYGPYGFRREAFFPCYGLAEGTLIVSGIPATEAPRFRRLDRHALERGVARAPSLETVATRTLVGCGPPVGGQEVSIVDPETRRECGPGEIGEIWVVGPSVARGYWERPTESAATFGAHRADGAGPFLRTGDLGFFDDGQLYIAGRLKDLIIIRGRNLAPDDVERVVEQAHPAVRVGCGAAFTVEDDAGEHLVVACEAAPGDAGPAAVVDAIRDAVAATFGLALHAVCLLEPRTVPKTSSGKIQRHACRRGFLAGSLSATWNWSQHEGSAIS